MQGPFLRKYGVQTTIKFTLFEVDGIDFRVDAVPVVADMQISKDEGVEADTANGATDEGTGYSVVLTATEMQAARISIYVSDVTATKIWLDTTIEIETYGNASAQHAFDLDTNNVFDRVTIAEQAQGKPTVTPTAEEVLSYLYMEYIRNKVTNRTDGTDFRNIFADDTTTIIYKKSLADASNITTIGEAETGP